jgi:hypothetical protein
MVRENEEEREDVISSGKASKSGAERSIAI